MKQPIENIAVIGTGVIGAGWIIRFLFNQKKIKGLGGGAWEDLKVKGNAIIDKLIPNIPFVPGTYSTEKIEASRKGMKTPFKSVVEVIVTIAQTVGFKIDKADLAVL